MFKISQYVIKKTDFISYDQNRLSLLPPFLEDFVSKAHPVHILNEIIEKIDITSLNEVYKSRGQVSYHPKMLLKVLVYAYISNIYSSRKIFCPIKYQRNVLSEEVEIS